MANILGDDQKQQILALGRLGWPLRRIEQATGVRRETDLTSPRAGVRMDLTMTPWRDAYFDGVLCNPVLEHIPDDRQAMRELFRILRPGGWAILEVPMGTRRTTTFEDPTIVSPKARERAFGQADHVRIYGLDYNARLASVGFVVSVDPFVRELPMAARTRLALSREEDTFVCVKPPRAGRAHATRRLPSRITFIDRCLVQDLSRG